MVVGYFADHCVFWPFGSFLRLCTYHLCLDSHCGLVNRSSLRVESGVCALLLVQFLLTVL